jgi:hypothetical protein
MVELVHTGLATTTAQRVGGGAFLAFRTRSRLGVSGTAVDNQLSQRSRRPGVLQARGHPIAANSYQECWGGAPGRIPPLWG